MTPKEILAADIRKNNPHATMASHTNRIAGVIASGGQVLQQGGTLFMFHSKDKGNVEVHTYNADPAQQFVENFRKFLRLMKKAGAKQVYTTYDNPKLSDVAMALAPEFQAKITKDGKYTAKVRL